MKFEDYFEIEGTYELKDGVYNVDGDVYLIKILEKLPVKFGKVKGGFYCHYNNLISLKGAPKYIGGKFNCSYNNLISLEDSPEYVGRNFNCWKNNINSLKGCKTSVGGIFYCDKNLHNTKEYIQFKILEKLRT